MVSLFCEKLQHNAALEDYLGTDKKNEMHVIRGTKPILNILLTLELKHILYVIKYQHN